MKKTIVIGLSILFLILGFSLGFVVFGMVNGGNIKSGEWLSFTGAIIGGIIASISIVVTIARAKEEVREKEIKDVRPFIVFKPEFNNDFMASLDKKQDFCHYVIDTTIENVSDKLVNNLQLLEENVYVYNYVTKDYELADFDNMKYSLYTVLLDSREMIKPHNKFAFHTNLLIDKYSIAINEVAPSFKIITRYTYRDILDLVEYTHYAEYDLEINYTNEGKFILYANNLVNKTESYRNLKTKKVVKL